MKLNYRFFLNQLNFLYGPAAIAILFISCEGSSRNFTESDRDLGVESDADSDMENNAEETGNSDADGDSDWEDDSKDNSEDVGPEDVLSFIWIANTREGTLTKIDTKSATEVGRYWTSPQKGSGDPSRTSVNLYGDMVVTNRQPKTGRSSVTKFAAAKEDCIDRNKNGKIDTSKGPNNVLEWGEDECMLWNSILPEKNLGARATAWDGREDPETGEGGHVFIGTTGDLTTMTPNGPKMVFKLDGDTGDILASGSIPGGAYGGAVDGKKKGAFWVLALGCPFQLAPIPSNIQCKLVRIDMDTLETTSHDSNCGYGISIDSEGRVWTAGQNCIERYDPKTKQTKRLKLNGAARGIAVDGKGSVWAAMSAGAVVQVDVEKVTQIKRFQVGQGLTASPIGKSLVGMAVDYEGFIWGVSQGENAAYKIDPETYQKAKVPVGAGPYTYSDMTGYQLKIVDPIVQ